MFCSGGDNQDLWYLNHCLEVVGYCICFFFFSDPFVVIKNTAEVKGGHKKGDPYLVRHFLLISSWGPVPGPVLFLAGC